VLNILTFHETFPKMKVFSPKFVIFGQTVSDKKSLTIFRQSKI